MKPRLILGLTVLALLAASGARAELKVAYVDMQRALNECEAGKRAKAEFRVRIQQLERQLQRQQSEVQSLKSELEKKGTLIEPEQRDHLQNEYSRKLKDFERDYNDSRDELQHKDSEVTGVIVRDIAEVVRSLAEKSSYTFVMEKGSLLWGAPGIDITDEVIRAYNATGATHSSLGTSSRKGAFASTAARRSSISK